MIVYIRCFFPISISVEGYTSFQPMQILHWQNDNDNDNGSSRNAVEGRIVNLTDASDNPFIFQVRSNFLFRAGSTTTSLSIFGDNEADVTNTCALLFPLRTVGCCLTPPLLRHFLNRELAFEASSLRPDCIMSLSTYAQHPRSSTHEISSLDVVGETIAWRQFLENVNKRGIASRQVSDSDQKSRRESRRSRQTQEKFFYFFYLEEFLNEYMVYCLVKKMN